LGLENFRGLIGADQSFLQEELISLESQYVAHCDIDKLINLLKIRTIWNMSIGYKI
jgi:hypothetical protein